MIGLIACLLGFAVLIYLSYKDWSIYLAAFAAACVVIFLTGMPFVETLTDTFISGMAQGVDMYAAEIVLELKEQYPQITLECAIPYERQAVRWPAALRERYFSIAERCDKETMLQRQYTRDCMKKRNQYMVDCADVVLAVWNGEPSGTGQTVWYAKEKGKLVWRIDPATLVMEF